MDKTGEEIADAQEESARNRKMLASRTSEWRGTEDAAAKAELVPPLLKLYQGEIDRLSRRSKAAEGAFLELYRGLFDAPDPSPFLESALAEVATHAALAARVAALEAENRAFKEDVGELKNQDVSLRRLEEELAAAREANAAMAADMADRVRLAVAEKEAALLKHQSEALRSFQEREKSLLAQVAEARAAAAELQRVADHHELAAVEARSRFDEQLYGAREEHAMTMADLARAKDDVALARAQVADLTARLTLAEEAQRSADPAELARALAEAEARGLLLDQLRDQLADAERMATEAVVRSGDELARATRARDDAQSRLAAVETELAGRPTSEAHDLARRELAALKRLHFGGAVNDDDDDDGVAVDDDIDGPLGKLVVERCRRLETEVSMLNLAAVEMQGKLALVSAERDRLVAEAAAHAGLVASLEDQLHRASAKPPQAGEVGNPAAPHPPTEQLPPELAAALLHGGAGPSLADQDPPASLPGAAPGSEDPLLKIVTAQRDRFRQRMTALEEEKHQVQEKCSSLSDQVRALTADNLALFEKIRYLEAFNPAATAASQQQQHGKHLTSSASEDRYRELYEDSVNPFTAFSKNERQQRYQNLNPAEKITLSGGRILLSTKWARMLLFFYSVFLHVMVAFTLFHKHQSCTDLTNQSPATLPYSRMNPGGWNKNITQKAPTT
jgi:homeobox protein cut-like